MRLHRWPTGGPMWRRWAAGNRTAAVIGTAALLGALFPLWPAAAAPRPAAPLVPTLRWHSCYTGFQCATARVPLDYRHPRGSMIRIAVIRHLATDPAHRIGSLFVNGGGPGEQIGAITSSYQAIPAALRARFDIIDFDSRGFGYSTAVHCFPTMAAEGRFLSGLPQGFPVGAKQISVSDRTWARFDAVCARRNRSLLRHVSTADVARDMDLLRQAVGAPMLNYYGLSYATGLGAIYANLFPAKVGRMVLDGNLDPVTWTTDTNGLPMFLRDREDEASAATLKAFLDLCGKASTTACAFSAGTPAATRAKYSTLLRRLRRHPVTIGAPPHAQTCGYSCGVLLVPLTQVSLWPRGARQLQQLWTASTTAASNPTPPTAATAAPAAPYTGEEQTLAVECSDGPNPRDPRAFTTAARLAYARSGPIGLPFAWATEPCARWPQTHDRYTGPWNRPTASPILLVGNTGDPDTPYWDSVAMSHDLARARLLTVHGYGHTEFSNPSTCATNDLVRYLLTGALPAKGTSCQQNGTPFGQPSTRSGSMSGLR